MPYIKTMQAKWSSQSTGSEDRPLFSSMTYKTGTFNCASAQSTKHWRGSLPSSPQSSATTYLWMVHLKGGKPLLACAGTCSCVHLELPVYSKAHSPSFKCGEEASDPICSTILWEGSSFWGRGIGSPNLTSNPKWPSATQLPYNKEVTARNPSLSGIYSIASALKLEEAVLDQSLETQEQFLLLMAPLPTE